MDGQSVCFIRITNLYIYFNLFFQIELKKIIL